MRIYCWATWKTIKVIFLVVLLVKAVHLTAGPAHQHPIIMSVNTQGNMPWPWQRWNRQGRNNKGCMSGKTLARGGLFILSSFISLLLKLVPKHFMELWPHGGSKTLLLLGWKTHSPTRMPTSYNQEHCFRSGYLEFVWYHWHQTSSRFVLPGRHTFTQRYHHSFNPHRGEGNKPYGGCHLAQVGTFPVGICSCGATELILGSYSYQLNCDLSEKLEKKGA